MRPPYSKMILAAPVAASVSHSNMEIAKLEFLEPERALASLVAGGPDFEQTNCRKTKAQRRLERNVNETD